MVTLTFAEPGYVEDPYWPERHQLVDLEKRSGVNRARTQANRRRALQAQLEEQGMTLEDCEALRVVAARPFHTDAQGRIVIPAEKMLACLVNACDIAPAKLRVSNLRTALTVSDFVTDRTKPDGVWERFVKVTLGTGAKASHQKGLRRNEYLRNFTAVGTIRVEPDMVEPKAVLALLAFAGRAVGVGASRKMGWGRFAVDGTVEVR
ncbi:MAG TPA: hypothetical protein VFE48_25535 [Methylomirabilota bacterium]|nr:hypothetical protein [Methylomirabilota bacterium]